jgi:hypothetical protein
VCGLTAPAALIKAWGLRVSRALRDGRIAQLVEQGIENPRVGGSTPSLATTHRPARRVWLWFALACATGCGDACDQLCAEASRRLAACRGDALTWGDLGATSRTDFAERCRDDWDDQRSDLTSREIEVALDVCDDGFEVAQLATCEEIVAWYTPSGGR